MRYYIYQVLKIDGDDKVNLFVQFIEKHGILMVKATVETKAEIQWTKRISFYLLMFYNDDGTLRNGNVGLRRSMDLPKAPLKRPNFATK